MRQIRYFGVIQSVDEDGGFLAVRDDGKGVVRFTQREGEAAGVAVGDRIEFGIRYSGVAVEILLVRRARYLSAQAAAE